jgi:hypothetical protein
MDHGDGAGHPDIRRWAVRGTQEGHEARAVGLPDDRHGAGIG